MGSCNSTPQVAAQKKANKEIDAQLLKDKILQQQDVKMILLGPGECGKSTVLKQMRILHLNGYGERELLEFVPLINQNIVSSMIALLDAMKVFQLEFADQNLEHYSSQVYQMAEEERKRDSQNFDSFDSETIQMMKELWHDKTIQKCFEKRSQFQLNDSAKYFLDDLDRITANDFVPTEQDILRTRVATMGIVKVNFKFKGLNLHVFDVGGQKSERRKWIHCFDDVNTVIFIAALSSYDIVMREDEEKNRMHDTLDLFGQISHSEFFVRTDTILFLNKQDIFAEKLRHSPITIAFPSYKGSSDYNQCLEYIKEQFLKLHTKNNKMKIHVTSATDTQQIKVVIDKALATIMEKNMRSQKLI